MDTIGARPRSARSTACYIPYVTPSASSDLRLPCARCGALVRVAAASAALPERCDRCTSGADRGVAYTLRQGGVRMVLDHGAVAARIENGELRGTDFVRRDDGAWVPVAGHPAFRARFLPGAAQPRRAAKVDHRPMVRRVTGVAAVATVIAGALWAAARYEPPPPQPVRAPATPTAAVAPGEPAPFVGALAATVGDVAEPRALLVAQAWAARYRGGSADMAEAVRLAERAVVRTPDAESLGLLAMLDAERHAEPERRAAALAMARAQAPDHIAVLRAEAAAALAEHRTEDARAALARCAQIDPRDTWCALHAIDVADGQTAADRLRALDALAATGLGSVPMVLRRQTTAAIDANAEDAWRRVEGALAVLPGDPELTGYKGILALRSGDLRTATSTARALGADAPARLRLDLAAHDIGSGNARGAREWLEPLRKAEPDEPGARFELALHSAQAQYLEAVQNPAGMAAAAEAADGVLGMRPTDATAAQVRMLAALGTGDLPAARKAFGAADVRELPGPDAAQVLLTAVELDLQGHVPREAIPTLEQAQRADPAHPDVWLWTALAGLEADDARMAVNGLRAAIAHVDGTAASRNPLVYALPRPADPARVRQLLHQHLDGLVGEQDGLTLALAAVDWLDGHPDRALDGIRTLVAEGTEPYAQVLAARIELGRGNAAVALPLAEAAAGQLPKEASLQLLRARCLHALRRDDEARRALSYVTGDGSAGYELFLAQMAGADTAAASRHARAVLAADPYNTEAVGLLTLR